MELWCWTLKTGLPAWDLSWLPKLDRWMQLKCNIKLLIRSKSLPRSIASAKTCVFHPDDIKLICVTQCFVLKPFEQIVSQLKPVKECLSWRKNPSFKDNTYFISPNFCHPSDGIYIQLKIMENKLYIWSLFCVLPYPFRLLFNRLSSSLSTITSSVASNSSKGE